MPEETQRKLAAVMAADVVGYSRLMGDDEAGTLAALREFRITLFEPSVAEHRGEVAKNMGDGWLVTFDSAIDAVACARAVQEKLAENEQIKLRIGLHIGDVTRADADIYGDGVNIAARLQELADPGAIVISDVARRSIDTNLAAGFSDLGQQELKNIAEPVDAFGWGMTEIVPVQEALALPDKPSIAVLPFDNISGDPEQEYFADGITEDIIIALSKIRSLFVIARNSSFVYKDQAMDARTVSASLGVRYVLEGSVRKASGQVRITGQLIDALTGANLWADQFQGPVDDIFKMQDQVTAQVISAVVPSIRSAEISRARRKSPRDLNAYDFYLQALAQINLSNAGSAFPLLSRARVLAPDFAPAFGLEAWCRTMWSYSPNTPDFVENARTAVVLARKALGLDDDDPELLGQIGYVLAFFEENIDLGLELVRNALNVAPSLAWLWGSQGFLDMFFGNCADAVAAFETSRRLDPHDPLAYRNNLGLAQANFMLGEHETALKLAKDAFEQASENVAVLRSLAAFYAQLGDADHAREFLEKHMVVYPDFRIKTYLENHPIRHAKNIDHFRQALRNAGLPE